MIVYGIISDNGDGSNSLQLFSNKELVDFLLNDDLFCEQYAGNEGVPAIKIKVPEGMTPQDLGLNFVSHQTIDSFKQAYGY